MLDNGIVATVASWGNYVFHLNNSQLDVTMCRGFRLMFDEIQLSLGNFFSNWSHSFEHFWFGYFTLVGVMIGVKGTSQGVYYYFDVFEEGRLLQIDVELSIGQTTPTSSERWIFHPSPFNSMLFC